MSKRSIAYIKPEEPNFLKRMKAEIGYKEDTSIELKRANLPRGPEDLPELEDSEVPQIVVLAPGDLTEEQFKAEKARINKQEEQKPADLSQRVIFKRRERPGKADKDDQAKQAANGCSEKPRKKKEAPKPRPIVSFDDDCDDE